MTPLRNISFFKNQDAPATSKSHYNTKEEELAFEVSGSGTFKIYFEGQVDITEEVNETSGNWTPIAAINLTDFSLETDGITKPGIYTFAIENIQRFRVRIESIAGGAITVFGRGITEGH